MKHTDCLMTADYENAVAQLDANAQQPPEVPGMPAPNNFGGNLAGGPASGPANNPAGGRNGRHEPRRAVVVNIGPPGMDHAAALAVPINQIINRDANRGRNGKLYLQYTGRS
jgi:hypothetical protein